jgi:hypothetical protein
MTKKIFALVMVVSVLGAFMAGCKKDDAAADGGSASGAMSAGSAADSATK